MDKDGISVDGILVGGELDFRDFDLVVQNILDPRN